MIDVKIKRMSETAIKPTYGSKKAACMDLYADIQDDSKPIQDKNDLPCVCINPHSTVKIGTGWAFQPPEGYVGLIFARSGISTKKGLRPANAVGVCDEDFTAEYIVALHNDTDQFRTVVQGQKIAQLMFIPYKQINLIEVEELNETERGSGGFGSTGE